MCYRLKVDQGVDNAVFTSQTELSDFAQTVHHSKVQYVKYSMNGRYRVSGHCVQHSNSEGLNTNRFNITLMTAKR